MYWLISAALFLLGLYLLAVVGFWVQKRLSNPYQPTPFGFKGRLLYADDDSPKNDRPFLNRKYGVIAKPDFVYELPSLECVVVEYKNRNVRIEESDKAQTIASALALRPHYPVKKALIKTKNNSVWVDVSGSDKQLHEQVKKEIDVVRQAYNGVVPACQPTKEKCSRCSLRSSCKKAA